MTHYTYAIADMHGRHDLFDAALDLIDADKEGAATGIVLGDFVDRGPDSAGLIDRLIRNENDGAGLNGVKWLILQGNHEAMMIEAMRKARSFQRGDGTVGYTEANRTMQWWIGNGGGQTLASYGIGDTMQLMAALGNDGHPIWKHIEWMDSLPIFYEDAQRIYVHAGVPFDQKPQHTDKGQLQWMLYDDACDDHGIPSQGGGEEREHVSGKHIVHGHHQSETHPKQHAGRTNLDSFAWSSGRLAIGKFDDTQGPAIEFLSVEK